MIHREKGELVCECSECGMEEFGGTLEWNDFIQHLKDNDWRIRKDGDEWVYVCPDCSR